MNVTPADKYQGYLVHHLRKDVSRLSSKPAWFDFNFRNHLPLDKMAPILDIGPGHGEILLHLIHSGHTRVTAIDISQDVVDACNSVAPNCAEYVSDTIEYLLSHSGKYSCILLFHVLEHVPPGEVPAFVAALHGALSNDGVLLLEVPNMAHPLLGSYFRFNDFTHVSGYTANSLQYALRLGGFTKISVFEQRVPIDGLRRRMQSLGRSIIEGIFRTLFRVYMPGESVLMSPVICAKCTL